MRTRPVPGFVCLIFGVHLAACESSAGHPDARSAAPAPVAAAPITKLDPIPSTPIPGKAVLSGNELHLPGYSVLLSTAWPGAAGFADTVAVIADTPSRSGRNARVLT